MEQERKFGNINGIVILFVLGILILSGCSSSYEAGNFDSKGLPKKQYLVGGGFGIEWVAPADGTMYLTEEKTGQIIITESIESGDEFSSSGMDPEEIEQVFGKKLSDLKFCLYFIPAAKAQTNPATQ